MTNGSAINHPKSLKKKIIFLFFGVVIGMLGTILATISMVLIGELTEGLKTSLSTSVSHVSKMVGQRLAYQHENITNFSRNHFIINGMVHPEGREEYLSKMVDDFSRLQSIYAVTIIDYAGNTIYSSVPFPPVYKDLYYLRPALETGEPVINLDKDNGHIVITEPIQHYETPIGAVVVEIDLEDLISLILPVNETRYYRLYSKDQLLFSHNYQEAASYIIFDREWDQEELSFLHRLAIRFEMGALKSVLLKPVKTVIDRLVFISVVFLLITILIAWKIGDSLSRPILTMVDKTRLSETDTSVRFSPLGTDDELEILARALDNRDMQLQQYQSNLEYLVERRTNELTTTNLKLEQEIAERKMVGVKLARQEARTRAIVNNLLDAIITIDAMGLIETFNPAAENIFGYLREEVIGRNVKMLMPDPYHSEHDTYLHNYRSTEISRIIGMGREVSGRRKDGSTFPMDLSVNRIEDEETFMFAGIIRDITDRKEAGEKLLLAKTEAEKANRAKSEFLANMSHEIRTPMNAVLGFSDLLTGIITDKRQKNYLNAIRAAGKSLLIIINDILDLSKIEAGRLELKYEFVNPATILEEIRQIFRPKFAEKRLSFQIQTDQDLPSALLIDETRIRQILFNLVGNAVKFTETGGVTLTAQYTQTDAETHTGTFKVSVADTGIGIPKKDQTIIFESFRQQDGQSTKKYGGTGLGLTITKRLTEMMNGHISMQSTVGVGSVFEIVFDGIEKAEFSESESTDEMVLFDCSSIDFEPAKILVVDDIASNRDLVRESLVNTPIEVIEADNGKIALIKTETESPDIVLMDIRMPVMDGIEATLLIKGNPATESIPIIALTASVTGEDEERVKAAGFDGFLLKPVKPKDLLLELTKFLSYTEKKNTSVSGPPDQPVALKHKSILDIERLAATLDREILPLLKELTGAMDMDDIRQFAERLLVISTEHQAEDLATLADGLSQAVENFDIGLLNTLIKSMPGHIGSIKQKAEE